MCRQYKIKIVTCYLFLKFFIHEKISNILYILWYKCSLLSPIKLAGFKTLQ